MTPEERLKTWSVPVFSTDDHGLPPEVIARAQAMRKALDAIRNAPPPDVQLPELTQKQQERLEAFALRKKP